MNRSILLNFAKQDIIDRYSGSILGGIWSFIIPLVNILIFALVFSKIMGAKLPFNSAELSEYGYSIYLVSGILAWNAFANILLRTTNIYKEKAGLIAKVNINLMLLPLYIIMTESVIFIISMGFFIIFLYLVDFPLNPYWLLIPIIYLLQTLFAYALGLLLATLSVFIKDIREFISIMLQLWFWFTPIVYVISILPDKLVYWFQLNPMYPIISAYRDIILMAQWPDMTAMSLFFIMASSLLFVSITLLKKLEKDLRDFI